MKRFIYPLLLLWLFLMGSCIEPIATAKAKEGVFDISLVGQQSLLELGGEWEFYWKQLIVPPIVNLESNEQRTVYCEMPYMWNRYLENGKEVGALGYATFSLRLSGLDTNTQYGIYMRNTASSYRLWIDEDMVATNGIVSQDSAGCVVDSLPMALYFNPKSNTIQLTIQVANFHQNKGGMWHNVLFGEGYLIARYREGLIGFDMFLFGSLIIMAIYHFGLFLLRRKDSSPLFFGLFCLLISIRVLMTGCYLFHRVLPDLDWFISIRVEYFTYYLAVPAFMLFLHMLYKLEFHRLFALAVTVLSLVASVLVLVLDTIQFADYTLIPMHVLTMAGCLYAIYALVMASLHKREGALLSLIGFIALAVTVFLDILSANQLIYLIPLTPLGLFIFIFFQSFVISTRFSRAFQAVETLSADLKVKSAELEEYSHFLEINVEDRTLELMEERNKLKLRNEKMESEIGMAKKIQMQMIPRECKNPKIAFYYKPMNEVGGDFYDFIDYPDPHLTGIFISDVSGHGVAAAFITSMIKTVLLQVGGLLSSPAEMLEYLNETLVSQNSEYFITAFFGVYNEETHQLVYANAGHPSPILIYSDGRMEKISVQNRGLPLAVSDSKTLQSLSKNYRNTTLELPMGCRLLLYTDGMTEAVHILDKGKDSGGSEFEAMGLMNVLLANKHLNSKMLTAKIVKALTEFRGSTQFDDDVCMICLEV